MRIIYFSESFTVSIDMEYTYCPSTKFEISFTLLYHPIQAYYRLSNVFTHQAFSIRMYVCGFISRNPYSLSSHEARKSKVNTDIAVRNRNYHTATGNHMPCGITQCYLPPGSGDSSFYPSRSWYSI